MKRRQAVLLHIAAPVGLVYSWALWHLTSLISSNDSKRRSTNAREMSYP